MFKRLLFVALFFVIAAPAMAQQEPVESRANVAFNCYSPSSGDYYVWDGSQNVIKSDRDVSWFRVMHDRGTEDLTNVQLVRKSNGTQVIDLGTLSPGDSVLVPVSGPAGSFDVEWDGGSKGRATSNLDNECAGVPAPRANFAFNCLAPSEGAYMVWDGSQNVIKTDPDVYWFRVFHRDGVGELTNVRLVRKSGSGPAETAVPNLSPGESVLVAVTGTPGSFDVEWDGGKKGRHTSSDRPCDSAPSPKVNFAFNCLAPDEGEYYVWDGTQNVVKSEPGVHWLRVFHNGGYGDATGVELVQKSGGSARYPVEDLSPGESVLVSISGTNGTSFDVEWDDGTKGRQTIGDKPCEPVPVPPAAVTFAFNCLGLGEGEYYVWDGSQDVVQDMPNVYWLRVFNSGGATATGVELVRTSGGPNVVSVKDLAPGESTLVPVSGTAGDVYRVDWDGGSKGTSTLSDQICTEVQSSTVTTQPETTTTTGPTTTTVGTDVYSGSIDNDQVTADTLPFTGPSDDAGLFVAAGAALLLLGSAALLGRRRGEGRHRA